MITKFQEQVFDRVRKIPEGKISTYSDIACSIGKPKTFRAVGNALNKNSDLDNVHCYRVVKSDGTVGEYAKGIRKKIELLKRNGAVIKGNKILNFKEIKYR